MIHSPDPQTEPDIGPVLNPAARLLWRSPGQIQIELGTRRLVVDGIDGATARRLDVPAATLGALHAAGLLVPRRPRLRATQIPRLAADLAALRVRYGERAEDVLANRRAATVAVLGTSRVAPMIAALLAAAGVGHVSVSGSGDVRLHQVAPGGIPPGEEGQRFTRAAVAAIARAAPDCDASPHALPTRGDLAVLAYDSPIDPELRDALQLGGVPHLVAQAGADHGLVGPLVLPGVASCLRCADLHRLDRDGAWSALAVQLAIPAKHGAPSDVSLASVVAGVSALQSLEFVDGADPATVEGTLEIQLPDWRLRRRSWPPHPDCDCGAHPAQSAGWAE